MTPEQVRAIVEEVLAGRLGGWQLMVVTVVLSLLAAGVGAYFGAYVSEKGKSRATREDLPNIVRPTESIKTEFAEAARLREELRGRQDQVFREANTLLAEFFTGQMSDQNYQPSLEFWDRWLAATSMLKVVFGPTVYVLFKEVDHFIGPGMSGRPSHEFVEARDRLLAAMHAEMGK